MQLILLSQQKCVANGHCHPVEKRITFINSLSIVLSSKKTLHRLTSRAVRMYTVQSFESLEEQKCKRAISYELFQQRGKRHGTRIGQDGALSSDGMHRYSEVIIGYKDFNHEPRLMAQLILVLIVNHGLRF